MFYFFYAGLHPSPRFRWATCHNAVAGSETDADLSQAVTCEQGSDVEKSDGQKKNGGGGCLYESDQRITWTLPPGLTASSMDMVRTLF